MKKALIAVALAGLMSMGMPAAAFDEPAPAAGVVDVVHVMDTMPGEAVAIDASDPVGTSPHAWTSPDHSDIERASTAMPSGGEAAHLVRSGDLYSVEPVTISEPSIATLTHGSWPLTTHRPPALE